MFDDQPLKCMISSPVLTPKAGGDWPASAITRFQQHGIAPRQIIPRRIGAKKIVARHF
jgi:hypothetical protein